MARELNIRAEVPRPKGILAQKRRADPPFERHRQALTVQDQGRPKSPNERIVVVSRQPAGREVQAGRQKPFSAQIPRPREVPIRKELRLVEAHTGEIRGDAPARTHRLQATVLRSAHGCAKKKPREQPTGYTSPARARKDGKTPCTFTIPFHGTMGRSAQDRWEALKSGFRTRLSQRSIGRASRRERVD